MLCGAPTVVHGASPCPRAKGHSGVHYWWLPWETGAGWKVIVYSGEPEERRRHCRGTFSARPEAEDVHGLLTVLSPLKKREVAARTPHSEPPPRSRQHARLVKQADGFALVTA